MSSLLSGRKLTMIVLSIQPNLEPPEDRPLGMCGELLPTADRSSSQAKVRLNEKERELSMQPLLSASWPWSRVRMSGVL